VRNIGLSDVTLSHPTIGSGSGFSVSPLGQTLLTTGQSTTFTVTQDTSASGSFTATLSMANNDSDENPFDLTVTGSVEGARIVDNNDAGWRVVSGTWGYNGSHDAFYLNDHHYHAEGTGTNVVEWEFTGLEPGQEYQVSATWAGTWNRADAPFTISDGVSSVTVVRDQGVAPNDFYEQEQWWEQLTNFTLAAGATTLTVQLADDLSGYVIADAVHVVPVSPLTASGGELSGSPASTLEASQVAPLLEAAVTQWSIAGLDVSALDALSQVQIAVADLKGATVGLADSLGLTIWLDANAAGYGWYVDPTPLLNEEYQLSVDGVLTAVAGSDAFGRMDLLTVLSHELGHLIGLEDLDADPHTLDVMAETLATGIRRVPSGARLASPLNLPKTDDSSFVVAHDSTARSVTRLAPDQPTRGRLADAAVERKARHKVFAQLADLAEDEQDDPFDPIRQILQTR